MGSTILGKLEQVYFCFVPLIYSYLLKTASHFYTDTPNIRIKWYACFDPNRIIPFKK